MHINIFLDDYRIPDQAYVYTKNSVYLNKKWTVVKNYKEFVNLLESLEKNDTIGSVSFDHDLSDEHYKLPQELFNGNSSEALGVEKTGLDCAKYFTEFINKTNRHIPGILVHSMNPVGAENIRNHIMDWMDTLGGKDS